MTARYRINHNTAYRYDQAVTASFNEVRLTPAALPWQFPLESTLRVEQSSWQYRYVDYWGTQVRVFEAHAPHRELVVEVSSTVEVDGSRRHTSPEGLTWDEVRTPAVEDEFAEFLTVSPSTEAPSDLAATAAELAGRLGPAEAALALIGTVHDTMTYLPGSTGVHTLASEAWAAGSGVCQDYAHLVLGALRHVGLPARYVSGYLHPKSEPVIGDTVPADSHAWVQWWLGEWVDHDPTNLSEVAERHIVVGTGREYRDVTPIKGIVAGTPATTDLSVEVSITRLA
ncbi:transglutaminase family protein [Jatrophihabitans sp.]|uniref:transglutaminase family protein n=1 Tax=Jatrophihabitans sp. TaxID=1932789 RepID=UPI0030C6D472|nr:transglutaminase family protein [Jatrophihabitans sp.]